MPLSSHRAEYKLPHYVSDKAEMMQGQKKSELALYVVLWLILFAAAAVSVYMDGIRPVPEELISGEIGRPHTYDWMGLLNTWQLLAMFCITFFIHNFLVAPLLVYRDQRWRYGLLALILMAAFSFIVMRRGHAEPMREGRPREMSTAHRDMPGQMPPPRPMAGSHEKDPNPMKAKPFGGPTTVAFTIMLLLLGLNDGTKYYFKSLDDRKRIKDLEREQLNQQLKYLRYQINPHFFMNTLNNIHALVDIDPDEAKHTIEILSKLMRYVLYETDRPMAPLQKELDFLGHYINLMRIRYTDRVRISVAWPQPMPDAMVPSLLLVTFVENAFKHGVSYQQDSFIDVSVAIGKGRQELTFVCRNSIKPEAQGVTDSGRKGHGVGLANAARRLQLIYGESYQLSIDTNGGVYNLRLQLPLTPITR